MNAFVRQSLLVEALRTLQPELAAGIKEFDLYKKLQAEPFALFDAKAMQDNLAIFQTHFVLFNVLYQLRDEWLVEQLGELDIHTTRIQLLPYSQSSAGIAKQDPLRAYYLDWQHFHDTSAEDVEVLIDDFWRLMGGKHLQLMPNEEEQTRARRILDLPQDQTLDLLVIKRQYRKLQHRHHPDKGGDVEAAKALVWAFEVLMVSKG